jgi:hypothetical protein
MIPTHARERTKKSNPMNQFPTLSTANKLTYSILQRIGNVQQPVLGPDGNIKGFRWALERQGSNVLPPQPGCEARQRQDGKHAEH